MSACNPSITCYRRRADALPDSVRAEENAERRLDEANWTIIEQLVEVAEQLGRTPAQVAIGWQMAKPFVTAPILGANRPAQLTDILDDLDSPLPGDAVAALDKVSDFHRSRTSIEA